MMHMRGYQSGTNPDVAIIIPSTGRAEQCTRLVERIHETSWTGPSIVVSVEPDDAESYLSRLLAAGDSVGLLHDSDGPGSGSHVTAINRAARDILDRSDPKLIIKLDDDHWPLTIGWDQFYLDSLNALGGTGVVYGNDLLQGEALPTVPGLSANIVRELGWYAPPQLGHLFCDNFWLELGRRSGRLSYMPHVLIEHRHPAASKAKDDATYAAGGQSPLRWSEDEREWRKMTSPDRNSNGRSDISEWARRVRALAERGSSR